MKQQEEFFLSFQAKQEEKTKKVYENFVKLIEQD